MMMRLSDRLELVVSFVKPGSRVADVGTDHGYVPIALIERQIAESAIAMDVRQGPLDRAEEHILQHGLENRIGVRLSDGVEKLEAGEADTVIAAGMGGQLIIHILEGGRRLGQDVAHWILSPQSEPDKVRYYLQENGFVISREDMVEEEGKYYVVMDAVPGVMRELSPAEALYGPCLIRGRNPVLKKFLEHESALYGQILADLALQKGEGAAARREELRRKAAEIETLLKGWLK